ncbi:MAG: hypothetical protein LBH75_04725, partial [Treponema sp.]|nr:hypothetical protein [Treponema sp.]
SPNRSASCEGSGSRRASFPLSYSRASGVHTDRTLYSLLCKPLQYSADKHESLYTNVGLSCYHTEVSYCSTEVSYCSTEVSYCSTEVSYCSTEVSYCSTEVSYYNPCTIA